MRFILFGHYLKFAWRSLWRYKLQTVISVVGLAVGLTCFAICNNQLLEELMWNNRLPVVEDTYMLVYHEQQEGILPWANVNLARRIGKEFPEVEEMNVYYDVGGYTNKICIVEREDGTKTDWTEFFLYTDSTFMDFWGFRLLQGNWEAVKGQPDAVILTPSGAARLFGTIDVVGRTFKDLDGFYGTERIYTVAALMEELPIQTDFENKAGLVLNPTDQKTLNGWYDDHASVCLRLRPGSSPEVFNQKIAAYQELHAEKGKKQMTQMIYPLKAVRDYQLESSRWNTPLIFSGIGILVLLAAVFNYVLFMSGRILNRQKEYSIRLMAGAEPRSLFGMFVVEITLSMVLAILVSFVLLELLIPLLTESVSVYLFFEGQRNWVFWFGKYVGEYALIVWSIMVVICWFEVRRLQQIKNDHKVHMQHILLGIQLAICILFAGGAYFLYAQQGYMQQKILGHLSSEEVGRIYSYQLTGNNLEKIRPDFGNLVRSNPYIEESCRTAYSLLGNWMVYPEHWQFSEIREESKETLSFAYVDCNYAEFIRARMEEGRFFREDEPLCAVVNREFVRRWGINPLGKDIGFTYSEPMKNYRIVGIIEDIVPLSDHPQITPCIYLLYPDGYGNQTWHVKLKPGADPKVLMPLREKMRGQVTEFTPLMISTLEEDIDRSVEYIQEIGVLTSSLALVCMVVCLLGIYSSMALAVEKRSKEMAIRKINGARITDIARIFGRYYFWLLSGAAIVAFPSLYLGAKIWLENYSFHTSITIYPFVFLFLLMVLIILITIGTQLLKIIRIDPTEVMKEN